MRKCRVLMREGWVDMRNNLRRLIIKVIQQLFVFSPQIITYFLSMYL